jgi:hypothetical protein
VKKHIKNFIKENWGDVGLLFALMLAFALVMTAGCAPRGDGMGNTRVLSHEVGRIVR